MKGYVSILDHFPDPEGLNISIRIVTDDNRESARQWTIPGAPSANEINLAAVAMAAQTLEEAFNEDVDTSDIVLLGPAVSNLQAVI